MALTRIAPIEAHVRWDRRSAQPARVSWAGREMQVAKLDKVRDERAAYPADAGPRITYLLRTDDGSAASLVFDGRRRRWFVEALDPAA